ncbi:MAG: hypothetical protein JO053_08830 [Acidobacteria bacterium]|nr:hypothetical protein [Acidobacteriota bacterium]
MAKHKPQNSALFVATLGVYLGLAIAGASPVFGHAATTRSFDIREVLETRDDLDTTPPENLAVPIQVYLNDLGTFLTGWQSVNRTYGFDSSKQQFEVVQSTMLPCIPDDKIGSYTAEKFLTSVEELHTVLARFGNRLTDGYSLQDCITNNKFQGIAATSSRFELKFDGETLNINIAVKKSTSQRAADLADALRTTFTLFRDKEPLPYRDHVLAATKVSVKDDQVFIVTHLPRGSLDTLLAS